MSCTQFHSIKLFILRHAWLNLWDKHMTTGRINQVTFQMISNNPHSLLAEAPQNCEEKKRVTSNGGCQRCFHLVSSLGHLCYHTIQPLNKDLTQIIAKENGGNNFLGFLNLSLKHDCTNESGSDETLFLCHLASFVQSPVNWWLLPHLQDRTLQMAHGKICIRQSRRHTDIPLLLYQLTQLE